MGLGKTQLVPGRGRARRLNDGLLSDRLIALLVRDKGSISGYRFFAYNFCRPQPTKPSSLCHAGAKLVASDQPEGLFTLFYRFPAYVLYLVTQRLVSELRA